MFICLLYFFSFSHSIWPHPLFFGNQRLKAGPAGDSTGIWKEQISLTAPYRTANNLQLRIRPPFCHFHLRGIFQYLRLPRLQSPNHSTDSPPSSHLFSPPLSSLDPSAPNPPSFLSFLARAVYQSLFYCTPEGFILVM